VDQPYFSRLGEQDRERRLPANAQKCTTAARRGPERLVSMARQVWIAPDFATLPVDMAETFGMTEPR
jgi:hypothetical protein